MEKLKAAIEAAEKQEEGSKHPPEHGSPQSDLKKSHESAKCYHTPFSSWRILRKNPFLLVVLPVLLAIVITALSVFGVTYAIKLRIETTQELAQAAARDVGDALRLQLNVVGGAALQLATLVQANPDWTWLEEKFPVVAEEIFRQNNKSGNYELAELLYAPFGKIAANYAPPDRYRGPITSDLFTGANLEILKPFKMVELGSMTVNGPAPLSTGQGKVIAAGYPIFIKNVSRSEDFNNPYNMTAPTGCEELCYDEATRTKFWGFSGAYIFAEDIISGEDEHLSHLIKDGYQYKISSIRFSDLSKDSIPQEKQLIAKSDGWKGQEPTATVEVGLPGVTDWQLSVHTEETEELLNMRDGLIAMIVIIAFLLAGLLSLLLITIKRARILLKEQLVTNEKLESANGHLASTKAVLEEEKQQREALLERQYGLISCFEQANKGIATDRSSVRSTTSSVAERQHATLEQIAALRRTMDEERSKCNVSHDDLRFFELLGEGSFGKVHRGSWRCTECAIKTMMLPANMSGAAKREKMCVMEAAISSSLTHPNIVQTYTYSIKPVREQNNKHTTGQRGLADSISGLGSAVQICGDAQSFKHSSNAAITSEQRSSDEGGAIHSFEVSLVLEYADKGSLRDALDQGAFITSDGLNYAGILDSATDIACAMLHLHCNNILHMDLKARNILLASSGTHGGRGVTCKVSDFGLAVRMEQTETHLSGFCQGTLTHIAPETLLEGQVSKAADVYAFGIVLWELFTSGHPYKGIPKALLGHKVCAEGCRPAMPHQGVMPQGYRDLVQACWARAATERPSFAEILDRLQALRSTVPGPTPPLRERALAKPTPKLPTVDKARASSLPAVIERSSQIQSAAAAVQRGEVGSTEPPPAHVLHGAEQQACRLTCTIEQPPPGYHQPNGHSSQQAPCSTGARRGSLDDCTAKPRKTMWFPSSGPEQSHGARTAADGAMSSSGMSVFESNRNCCNGSQSSRLTQQQGVRTELGPAPDGKQNSRSTWLPLAPELACLPADFEPGPQIKKGGLGTEPGTRKATAEERNSSPSSTVARPSAPSVGCRSSSSSSMPPHRHTPQKSTSDTAPSHKLAPAVKRHSGGSSSLPPPRHTLQRSASNTTPSHSNGAKHRARACSHSCIILIGDADDAGMHKASLEGHLSPIEELHESQNSCLGDQDS